jgi:hypothetical protein
MSGSSWAYVEGLADDTAVEVGRALGDGRTVEKTFAELLELLRELGADESHPAFARAALLLAKAKP